MSDSQTEILNRTLFNTRQELDNVVVKERAVSKVLNGNLTELANAKVSLEIAKENLANITTEYNNVLVRGEEQKLGYEKRIQELISAHASDVETFERRIAELEKIIQDVPETPAERLVETVLNAALSRLHTVVAHFAARSLITSQSNSGKRFENVSTDFISHWPNLFVELTVKEKQLVRENIRSYVQNELAHHWEFAKIHDIIVTMNASESTWKKFSEVCHTFSIKLIPLVTHEKHFDDSVNLVVEFILDQLK